MSRMQNGQIPIPLKRLSEESSTHSEDTTVHKYNYNHHSSDSNNNNNPPDIEKCQPYRGYRRHDDHNDDDDNDNDTDILSNASGDSIISSRYGRQRSRVVMFYAACYVAFAILSFFSATYYFLCWMPYEPSNSDPFPGRHR
ncbi:uncharacterized protein BO87DRAFT_377149 [Aspergillus neoniger CBS 115656]|uniref:Uncharacterized protein n=1 Tax=Aspergillus neoniger (strain CBS 115656) TaxID=1448310 RepID=A0A318YH95_ASPNB|nr:hypothetical protein BO87DRAFT_377149 [Aspergillus neoniger CBS 115656]PYH33444.1 hypothetical protein BO87DRAFT_377149 [Aspergillus neoniger CBS 115656]